MHFFANIFVRTVLTDLLHTVFSRARMLSSNSARMNESNFTMHLRNILHTSA